MSERFIVAFAVQDCIQHAVVKQTGLIYLVCSVHMYVDIRALLSIASACLMAAFKTELIEPNRYFPVTSAAGLLLLQPGNDGLLTHLRMLKPCLKPWPSDEVGLLGLATRETVPYYHLVR